MTSAPSSSANFCYRHPDRQSFILCQRCGRTICPQCQTQAAVGVHCPECVREGRASMPRIRRNPLARFRGSDQPWVTWALIALCLFIYVLQILPGSPVTTALVYYPPFTVIEPWRMITSLFVHDQGSLLHIGLNMLSLFIFGPLLEKAVGHWKFLALYLISGFGGSVAVLVLAPTTPVLGASGAIFGLLGAFFVIQRKFGGNTTGLMIIIGLNLVAGFVPGTNIAWQAHLGGLIAGAAIALVYLRTRRRDQLKTRVLLVSAVFVVLVIIAIVRILTLL
ncbi:MAG: rhomboid family intramembrane serine protease [Salinibacterium sp.]|nr:rhomboid family intramembrane serine protease [Salinibacterium sp.]